MSEDRGHAQANREAVPAPWLGRPAWVEIDLDAVTENVRRVRDWVGPGTSVMAVVKADGYGLGAARIASAAQAGGAAWLGVACVDEGVQLREAGLDGPILVLGPATPWEMRRAVAERLTITVNDLAVGQALAEEARQRGVSAQVHLKLDSGLHRFGRGPAELVALASALAQTPGLRLEGLYTHFANADDPDDDFARLQLQCLLLTVRTLEEIGIRFRLLHAASSSGLLVLPESRLDMVRVGIVLSGHHPSPRWQQGFELLPAVSVKAQIARVSHIGAGESVGYGRTYFAPTGRTLALVPMGYADGYHRALSNRGLALVGGRRVPVVGRISMDQLTLDVSEVPKVHEGNEVVLAGRQGDEAVGFDELAELAGTISYELLTHLGKRLPRVYLRDGKVESICAR